MNIVKIISVSHYQASQTQPTLLAVCWRIKITTCVMFGTHVCGNNLEDWPLGTESIILALCFEQIEWTGS